VGYHLATDVALVDPATVYVAPSYNGVVGLMVHASGDDAAFERGADDRPVPERCCAVCNGEPYALNGDDSRLYTDLFRTQPFQCATFALKFLEDTTIKGWYCLFYATRTTQAFVPTPGTLASHVYTPPQ